MPPKPAPRQNLPTPKPRPRKSILTGEPTSNVTEDLPVKLFVSDLPVTCSDDLLINYFERKKHFGRSLDVVNVEYDPKKNEAIITFKNNEDLQTVLQVHAESPCTLSKTQIHVEEYKWRQTKSNTSKEEEDPSGEKKSATPEQNTGTKMIMVKGYNLQKSEETLVNFLEKQCQKVAGEVKEVSPDKEMGCIFVEFTDEAAVQFVIEKAESCPFTLEGCRLSVKPCIYSQTEVLFTNIPNTVSEENLKNFVEARLKIEVSQIPVAFNATRDRAIVRFTEAIDLNAAIEVCKQRKLQDAFLIPMPVSETQTILVTSLPEDVTEDGLRFYFENGRKSGGGEIEDIDLQIEEEYCLITFMDPKVVEHVCQKEDHIVMGFHLKVIPYNMCLGKPVSSDSKKPWTKPDPLVTKRQFEWKLKYISSKDSERQKVAEKFLNFAAQFNWNTKPVEIDCTLTKQDKGFRKRAKTWTVDIEAELTSVMDSFMERRFTANDEIFPLVRKKLGEIILTYPDEVGVFIEKTENSVIMVSSHTAYRDAESKIQDKFDQVRGELAKQKEKITKTKQFEEWKVEYLRMVNFDEEISADYPNVKLSLDTTEGVVEFSGPQTEVNDVVLVTYEKLQKVRERVVKLPEEAITLLENPDTQHHIRNQLRQGNLLDLWELNKDSITVYNEEREDFSRKKMIFKGFYTMMEFEIDKESEVLQRRDKWSELKTTLYQQFHGCIVLEKRGSTIKLCMRRNLEMNVQNIFQKFLSKNSIYKEEIRIGKYILQFIRKHMEPELSTGMKTVQHEAEVKLDYQQTDMVVIQGTANGLSLAKKLFDSLTGRVKSKQHKLNKPGIQQYLRSARGQESIKSIETTTPCIIHVSESIDQPVMSTDQTQTLQMLGLTQACAETTLPTGQRVIVYGGDMIQLKVDVLVNAGNEEMRHTGGLAAAIIKAGGRSIQKECSDYVTNNGSVPVGDVVVSGSGNLVCKYIIHAVGPRWSGGDKQEPKLLESAIENCLIETDKRQCCSIAFPALCTGVYKYPVDKACELIITTIHQYFQAQRSSSVKDIYLCDINPKTVNAFMKALSAIAGIRQIQASASSDKVINSPLQASKHDFKKPRRCDTKQAVTKVVFGNTSVEIVKGNISTEQVDVIINSASGNLDLGKGNASKALLKAGGTTIQDECRSKYPNGISVGDVATTTAGNLPSKNILHICLHPFNHRKSVDTLESCVENCLHEADKLGSKTVAFPALGTGAQNYPANIVAQTMFTCVSNYCQKQKDQTSIKSVKLVVFHKDTKIYETFLSTLGQYTGQGKLDIAGVDINKVNKKVVNISKDSGEYQIGEISVHVIQGDITDQDTVAVVTSSNTDLDLVNTGQVTKALLSKGGSDVEKDCEKKRDQMKSKGIVVTTGGQLKCKHIIFVAAPDDIKLWEQIVLDCLKTAEGLGITSVSIPALGTVMGHDPGSIASMLYVSICRFVAERVDPKVLQQIKIVIYQQTMVETFIKGIKSSLEGQSILSQLGQMFSRKLKPMMDSLKMSPDLDGVVDTKQYKPSETDDLCVLTIYAEGIHKVDDAYKRLEKIIADDWCSQTITDNAVWKLDKKQVDNIIEVAKKNNVRIEIDQDVGEIKIQGLHNSVMSVKDTIYSEFRAFDKIVHEKKHAELLTSVVKWFWIDTDSTSKQFQDIDILKIETAYKNKEKSLTLTEDTRNEDFEIDFQQMHMFYIESPKVKYVVMRRDIIAASSIETPKKWDPMGTDENLRMVKLAASSQEYADVAAEFTNSVGRVPNIIEIHRIQNKTLYMQYAAKRKLMEACNQGIKNEHILWHGTDVNAYQSIIAHGYNRSYCGKNAVVYGEGVYFAVSAQYSDRNTYAKPEPGTGHKRMYRALVLVGHYTNGQTGMRVPPVRQKGNPDILYDSVTDRVNNPGMYIIFHDTQAYPDYIITYI